MSDLDIVQTSDAQRAEDDARNPRRVIAEAFGVPMHLIDPHPATRRHT